MKKLALLMSLMLIFAFTSFAQVDVTVEGSSTLTLGIALDEPVASGFINENDAKISFSLGSGDAEKGAEEDVYGYIIIEGWAIDCNSDDGWGDMDAGDVTAKIMFPGLWVKISGTNNGFNFVDPVQDDDADPDNDDHGGVNTSLDNSGGIVVGLDIDPLALEFGLFSEDDWTQDDDSVAEEGEVVWVDVNEDGLVDAGEMVYTVTTPAADATDNLNDDHAYGISVKATADIAPITVEVGAVLGLNYVKSDKVGLGGKVTADLAPLTIYAAADLELQPGADPAVDPIYEFCGGLSVALVDGLSLAADASYSIATNDNTDVKICLTEDGAGGVVPALGASVGVELFNLLETATDVADDGDASAEWAVTASLDYDLGTARPYAEIRYGTYTVSDDAYTYVADTQKPFKLNVGIDLTMITNVTLTLDYNSDDLTSDDKSKGVIKVIAKIEY